MAVVNANYEFTLIDIGDSGRQSDGGVFAASKLGYAMKNELLQLPRPRMQPRSQGRLPLIENG